MKNFSFKNDEVIRVGHFNKKLEQFARHSHIAQLFSQKLVNCFLFLFNLRQQNVLYCLFVRMFLLYEFKNNLFNLRV